MNRRGFLKRITLAMVGTAIAGTGVFIPKNEYEHLFPLIRRVYPELLVSDLIGVQPMTGPVGTVFHMNII